MWGGAGVARRERGGGGGAVEVQGLRGSREVGGRMVVCRSKWRGAAE